MFARIEEVTRLDQVAGCIDAHKRYLVLAGEGFPFEKLSGEICAPWLGAVFPALFSETTLTKAGAFVCELDSDTTLGWNVQEKTLAGCQSFLTIVDGNDPLVGEKLELLFENTPAKAVVFGGGSGCLERQEYLYMYNGDGYTNKGIILLGSAKGFVTEARHGYDCVGDFSMISKAVHNVIEAIDFKEAFSAYKRLVHERFGAEVTPQNIFEMGLMYPLMFERAFGEKTIRIPKETDGRMLKLAGDALEDTVVSLGSATKSKLLEASSACARAVVSQRREKDGPMFVFDCVGRQSVLAERFTEEIDGVRACQGAGKLVGVLSLGEIANSSKSYVELYNNTCVVGAY
ncbi:MAG: FIST C-terminal domain-containing protein [Campylobacterales bacterium]|nr:FIST C-terminal domain-containing protein [Campylobacterales bacterium]